MSKITLEFTNFFGDMQTLQTLLANASSSFTTKIVQSASGGRILEIDDPEHLISTKFRDFEGCYTTWDSDSFSPPHDIGYYSLSNPCNPAQQIPIFTHIVYSENSRHKNSIQFNHIDIKKQSEIDCIVRERKIHLSLSERIKQVDILGRVEFLAGGKVQFPVLPHIWEGVHSCLRSCGVGSEDMLTTQQRIFDTDRMNEARGYPRALNITLTISELDRFLQAYEEQQQEAKRREEKPQQPPSTVFRALHSRAFAESDSSSAIKEKLALCDIVQRVSSPLRSDNIIVVFKKGGAIPDTPCTTRATDYMRIYTPEQASKLLDAFNPEKEETKTYSRKMS